MRRALNLHAGKNLPENIIVDLKALIHQISKVCLQVIKPETPVVLELISKDYSMATTTDWELDKSHWMNVITQLQLTDQQVITILRSREQASRQGTSGVPSWTVTAK